MEAKKDNTRTYVSEFEDLRRIWSRNGGVWAEGLRSRAMSRFRELGFPTTRHEEWKYTSVRAIQTGDFRPVSAPDRASISPEQVAACCPADLGGPLLVFVDGHYAAELSHFGADSDRSSNPRGPEHLEEEGLEIAGLDQIMHGGDDELEKILGMHARFDEHSFVALNTALMQDGAFLRVARGAHIEKPVQLLFISVAGENSVQSTPRILVVAGENAQLTIVESYVSLGDAPHFTNAVSEVVLEAGAIIDHYKLQSENDAAFHIATLAVHQSRSSNFRSHSITLGGQLTRNDVVAVLDGEGCECTLNGVIIGSGTQLMDNHTRIVHGRPNCQSHELYRAVLDDRARGVFNGKIFVAEDAQKTDAFQSNKTLVLSDGATMNTKPELEIYADDVKCSHGATIGQLDRDALFYLRSRGLDKEIARSLMTFAFAGDVISGIRIEELRSAIQRSVFSKLPQETVLEGLS